MNDLAVVILNWNGVGFFEKFLDKVVRFSGDAKIVVADNASTDSSIKYVQANFPNIKIIQNPKNDGFAKGYNDALHHVDSKFYMLLNSDIEVTENWLVPLYDIMKDESIAGCQPKILSHSNKDTFEHAGASGGFIDKNYFPFCRGRLFNSIEKDEGQFDNTLEVFWATGAALMIRAELYHKVNGFDAEFFAHMEEIDLCWRLKKQNYKFFVVPASTVYHVGGGTLPYSSPRKTYLNFRNNLMMLIKNHQGILFSKLIVRMLLDGIAGGIFLLKGEFGNFWAVIKAHFYIYGHFGMLLRKRKEVKKMATEFNATGYFGGNIIWNYFAKGVKSFSELNQRLFK